MQETSSRNLFNKLASNFWCKFLVQVSCRCVTGIRQTNAHKTDNLWGAQKMADLKMTDQKNDRCVRRSTGRRLIPGNYVRFMHRCRVRRLARYRRQPRINSGHDSDQRQLLTSVLRTMEADLSVSRRCFFEKIPKERGYLYACENNLYKQVQKKGESTASSSEVADCCEVCLLVPRTSVALLPCGHSRFCSTCADTVASLGNGCPLCRSRIDMVLRVYNWLWTVTLRYECNCCIFM